MNAPIWGRTDGRPRPCAMILTQNNVGERHLAGAGSGEIPCSAKDLSAAGGTLEA